MYISKLNRIVAGQLRCHAKGIARQTFRRAGSSNSRENDDGDGVNGAPKAMKYDYAKHIKKSRDEKLKKQKLGYSPSSRRVSESRKKEIVN